MLLAIWMILVYISGKGYAVPSVNAYARLIRSFLGSFIVNVIVRKAVIVEQIYMNLKLILRKESPV